MTTSPSPFGSLPPYRHPEGTRPTPNRPTVEQGTRFEVQYLDRETQVWRSVQGDPAETAAYVLYRDCLRAHPDRTWRIVRVVETLTVEADEVGLIAWFASLGGDRPSVDIADLAAMLALDPVDDDRLWRPSRRPVGEAPHDLPPAETVQVRAGRLDKVDVLDYARAYQAGDRIPGQEVTDDLATEPGDPLAYVGRLHVLVAARLLGRPVPVALVR